MQTNGQRTISLSRLRAMDARVPEDGRLPIRNEVDLRRMTAGPEAGTAAADDPKHADDSRDDGKRRKL